MQLVKTCTDWFMEKHRHKDLRTQMGYQFVGGVSILLIGMMLFFDSLFIVVYHAPILSALMDFGVSCAVIVLIISVRRGLPFFWSALAIFSILLLEVVSTWVYAGSMVAINAIYNAGIPMMAVYLLGIRRGSFLTILFLVAHIGASILQLKGIYIPTRLFPEFTIDMFIAWNTLSLMAIWVFSLIYEHSRNRMEAEKERIERQLREKSRYAGMAEVASGVIHNVGNIVNSANVASEIILRRLLEVRIELMKEMSACIDQTREAYATELKAIPDDRFHAVLEHFSNVVKHLEDVHHTLKNETHELKKHMGSIVSIIESQQRMMKYGTIDQDESFRMADVVHEAVAVNELAIIRHGIRMDVRIDRDWICRGDHFKAFQILLNLISNAKYAFDSADTTDDKRIAIWGERDDVAQHWMVHVEDNGIGITEEQFNKLFVFGYTTRAEGHGFGLHNALLAAKDMGGDITAQSKGQGQGARFTLHIPFPGSVDS